MEHSRLTSEAITILEKRYLKRDPAGKVTESPDEMFWRVARNIAEADLLYEKGNSPEDLSGTFFRAKASPFIEAGAKQNRF